MLSEEIRHKLSKSKVLLLDLTLLDFYLMSSYTDLFDPSL